MKLIINIALAFAPRLPEQWQMPATIAGLILLATIEHLPSKGEGEGENQAFPKRDEHKPRQRSARKW